MIIQSVFITLITILTLSQDEVGVVDINVSAIP